MEKCSPECEQLPLRAQERARVNQVSGGTKAKCWICPSSDHWVDQCKKFMSMSPNERLKIFKENLACYSCLTKAGRDHRAANCNRKLPCSEMVNNASCNKNHHPLLHAATNLIGILASAIKTKESLLPVKLSQPLLSATMANASKRTFLWIRAGAQIR